MATVTPKFRVSYPTVFTPRLNSTKEEPAYEYSVQALFEKDADFTALEALEKAAKIKRWGVDESKWPKNLRSPFKDQGDRAKDVNGKMVLPNGCVEGAQYLDLKSKEKPAVVDGRLKQITDESQFYAGCYALASIIAYTYDVTGNRGVSFGLMHLQKVAEGEPFGNRTTPEQDFSPIEGSGEDEDADNLFN